MDMGILAQILGWAATILAMTSYGFKKVKTLRIVNLTAAVLFVTYGALIFAPAIIIGNASIAVVHILHLTTKGNFAKFLKDRPAVVWGIFFIYAAIMLAWTCWQVWMGTVVAAEILGTISAVGMVGAFLIGDEKKMRMTSMIFTVGNIIYSALVISAQMIVTNVVALWMNWMRHRESARQDNTEESAGAHETAAGNLLMES